jgi:hypothetical protein
MLTTLCGIYQLASDSKLDGFVFAEMKKFEK